NRRGFHRAVGHRLDQARFEESLVLFGARSVSESCFPSLTLRAPKRHPARLETSMANHDIVVIGASTGGVDVLTSVMAGRPPGLPASLFVVCHFPSGGRSVLPDILSRAGPLLATHAVDGEPFHPGQVYVAPPDHHLLLQPGGRMQLSRGPRENNHRPAV